MKKPDLDAPFECRGWAVVGYSGWTDARMYRFKSSAELEAAKIRIKLPKAYQKHVRVTRVVMVEARTKSCAYARERLQKAGVA